MAGEVVRSLEYFRDLRSVCALVLSIGEAEDLGSLPDVMHKAFAMHIRCRQGVYEKRTKLVAAGKDWRTAPRSRPYTGPPVDAALMAAVAPVAVEVLDAGSPEALAESLESFVERVRKSAGRDQTSRRFAYFGFSPRLETAVDRCRRPHRTVSFRIVVDAKRFGSENVPYRSELTADHVPQLFWEEPFEAYLVELLPGILPDHARRACSMWLAKLLCGSTWEAARELGLPPGRGRSVANKVVSLLNSSGNAEDFRARLLEIATRMTEDPVPVNYGQRRRALSTFADLPFYDWTAICRSAGASPGYPGGKSRHAAAWLWGRLTGGDPKLSPGFRKKGGPYTGDLYRRFLRDDLLPNEDLRTRLERYGLDVLAC